MALMQNEEFVTWYLRTSYLASVKDGVADRLINVNSSVLNTPGFRAAGWSAEPVQRTHSPPIPTTLNSQYFQSGSELQFINSHGDDEDDEGGLVTGRTSNDTIGPAFNPRRRRKKEQVDDDDSSDLTDESEDEAEGVQRAAQQIRFAKMPARERADSSPMRATDGREVMNNSPSKPIIGNRKRGGSLGQVEAVKARARADTTTSSDMSSENEVDPAYFRRRQLHSSQVSNSLSQSRGNEGRVRADSGTLRSDDLHDDSDADSVGSALSSELGETVDSSSILNTMNDSGITSSPPTLSGLPDSGPRGPQSESPKKQRTLPMLQELPPPRPISLIQPQSLLSAALNAQKRGPSNPVQAFAGLSGKGAPNPLWIKIYVSFSKSPDEPFEMPLARTSKDGKPVTVAEAIGFSLWTYGEDKLEPALSSEQLNVNKWTLRMVEDGEVDDDFPPLGRARPITDFTDNNNRGARGRSRGRPYDEFGLVEASASQLEKNNKETPQYIPIATEETATSASGSTDITAAAAVAAAGPMQPQGRGPSRTNILLAGQPFTSALSNTSLVPADRPEPTGPRATPRVGTLKTLKVRYLDDNMVSQSMTMEISTAGYIAEILDHVCKRWNLEKAGFVLRVAGTTTVAPPDRTVEALGARSELELIRKRFGAGVSLTGSPGSSSPNAPLLLDIQGPKKGKRGPHPLAQAPDMMSAASNFKKYYVTRKQMAPFSQGSQRVLVFDGDMLHVMAADTGTGKSSSIIFNDILRCKVSTKHSKLVRVVVRRGNESKRYDFEARSAGEAQEIVDEVTKEMRLAKT